MNNKDQKEGIVIKQVEKVNKPKKKSNKSERKENNRKKEGLIEWSRKERKEME